MTNYGKKWTETSKVSCFNQLDQKLLGGFLENKNMDDFRTFKFRTPPGIPGQTYKDIGIASVAMGGGDILPALEAGTIDAAR